MGAERSENTKWPSAEGCGLLAERHPTTTAGAAGVEHRAPWRVYPGRQAKERQTAGLDDSHWRECVLMPVVTLAHGHGRSGHSTTARFWAPADAQPR